MFEYDLQIRQFFTEWYQNPVDENGFPSKISIEGSVTSPCINKGIPCFCISSSVAMQLSREVTPASELVDCACRIQFGAVNDPAFFCTFVSSGLVLSVK